MTVTDTVARADATPGQLQPFAELGLTQDEYDKIVDTLGRRPTSAELALYSVMWSEHCSYKSSKVHLRQFAAKAPPSDALLAGIGHNAGVVDIGQGYAVTFKIESHNHPSYVEPHQGAATGVGGIVRDILAMGARPIAVMDALRFGPASAPDTRRVLPGVVSGISFYGNCLGLPNIGGELDFDPTYAGNPLVNALCVGIMGHRDLQVAAASGAGNKVILFGSTTGPDGVGGASVLASATFGGATVDSAKRPSVQVGDPFTEKLLVECCLELFAGGLTVGIQDLGAAGVACATTELAAAGTGGMLVNLDEVPLRDASLGPPEILMSESQERMMAVVEPGRVDDVPRRLRQVGRPGRGDRRGDGHRAAGHDLARRAGGGHPALVRGRRPGLRPAGDAPGGPGRAGRRRPGRAAPPGGRRGPARGPAGPALPRPAWPTRAGSPTSTTGTSAATPCWPCRKTAAWSGWTRRPGSASPWPPTATAATAGSTPTWAPSWRCPRPTVMSRRPGRARWP